MTSSVRRVRRGASRLVRRSLRVVGIGGANPAPPVHRPAPDRAALRPGAPGGLTRVHLGCGPHNLDPGWWNVDIRPFAGIDEVADVTRPWPWRDLEAAYGEHLLEHLEPDGAWAMLREAAAALRPGGVLRLSTPSLEWVWLTHFDPSPDAPSAGSIEQTYSVNRAFRGWGHRFLYSRAMLERALTAAGFAELTFERYGESSRPGLRGLERHTDYGSDHGYQHVWIVEAVRGDDPVTVDPTFEAEIEQEFTRFVRSGH